MKKISFVLFLLLLGSLSLLPAQHGKKKASTTKKKTPSSKRAKTVAVKPKVDSLPFADSLLRVKPSQAPGFYKQALTLKFSTEKDGAQLRYTLDGNPVTSDAPVLEKAGLKVEETTLLRVAAYYGKHRGPEWVGTYFFGEEATKFPVLSLAIKPSLLFNASTGLFKLGRGAKEFPHRGANYYSTKEFPAHLEFFEADKALAFDSHIGFKIFGGTSRIFPQKSLALYARKKYGKAKIKHKIFPDRKSKSYKRLVLRNSGSDYGETHFRDAFITSLGHDVGLEVQAYRPSLVFLNGRYWGIYNLREKLTKHYIVENFGLHVDSFDLLEHKDYRQNGSSLHYHKMQAYMRDHDLADPQHFQKVAEMMDVENFMEYQIIQIYIDNRDAGGNIKFWRDHRPGGKWRWILFDTDFGFAHYDKKSAKFNSLDFHTDPKGPSWPNPPWSTFNLRMLLKNKTFKDQFVLRFADRINTLFDTTYLFPRIDSFANNILPELPRHWKRWELDQSRYYLEVAAMKEFSRERPQYMRRFLQEKYPHIGPQVEVQIQVEGGGTVQLNDIIAINKAFKGIYFRNLPITLKAKPGFGVQFSHWELNGQQIESLNLEPKLQTNPLRIKAVFKTGNHPLSKQLIINEISHRDTLSGDWIEFFNASDESLSLQGWQIRDKKNNQFVFPPVNLSPSQYLVVCQDLQKFRNHYGDSIPAIGNLNFGLGKRHEKIEIYDAQGQPVDSMGYDIPKASAKGVFYLALRDFNADNGDFENWKIEEGAPSPGRVNHQFIEHNQATNKSDMLKYLKIGAAFAASIFFLLFAYLRWQKQNSN